MNPTVYIIMRNSDHGLSVEVRLDRWKGEKIIASADVEDVRIASVPQPEEDEYRHWATAVARAGARALEDALMTRVYAHTAKAPLTWEPASKNPSGGSSQKQ